MTHALRHVTLFTTTAALLMGCADQLGAPAPGVTIEPAAPTTSEPLRAVITAENVEGTPEFAWLVDGEATDLTGAEVPADRTAKGQRWEVVARIGADGVPSRNFTTIRNTPPELTELTWVATDPSSGDDLVASASGTDIDGDEVSVRYTWLRDGTPTGNTGPRLPWSETRRGQSWEVRATAHDGESAGSSQSLSITIGNTPPQVRTVTLLPPSPNTLSTIRGTVDGVSDADLDPVEVRLTWFVDGTAVGGQTELSLPSPFFRKNQVVELQAEPFDGTDAGPAVRSAPLTVANTAPTRPGSPVVTPTEPGDLDELFCTVTMASTDLDEDPITYEYQWFRDGELAVTDRTGALESVLSAEETLGGERWFCRVFAVDDDGARSADAPDSRAVTITTSRDGQVRQTDGTWIDFVLARCGSGTSCTATDARNACTEIGGKVASHASDGTDTVFSLGASRSCSYSTSYYQIDEEQPGNACVLTVSNLDWSDCCGRGSWHGQTYRFPSPGTVFGHVISSDSGYDSSYSNAIDRQWGCLNESTSASLPTGCTEPHVACVFE